jgi:glyoxylase-like metal-dependent hydrolase (beta-lactamase superfamily II)
MALSRRSIIAASGLIGTSTALGVRGPTPAQASPGAPRGYDLLSRRIGSVEVTPLLDGYIDVPLDAVIGADPAEATALAAAVFQAPGSRRIPVNAYLLRVGGRLVLVDTGAASGMGATLGRLPTGLEAAGVSPDQVDVVLISHMHPDHINGALTPEGHAMFPNAELVVPDVDYAFWHNDANLSRAPDEMKPFFLGARKVAETYANRLRRVSGENEIIDSIRSVPLPGHTPGHTGFILESDGEGLFIWADLVHIAAYQLARPEWGLTFDTDPHMAAVTRRRALERASMDRILIAGMHLPFPGFGHAAREREGYRFIPAEWDYVIKR